MKTIVRSLSILGLVAYVPYIGYVILLMVLGGMSASSTGPSTGLVFFCVIFPFIYFVYCLCSTFSRSKGPLFVITGIIAHLLMLPVIVLTFHSAPTALIGLGCLAIMAAWFGMYFEKVPKKD